MSKSAPVERVGGALCKQSSEVREMYRVNECIHYETGVVKECNKFQGSYDMSPSCKTTPRRSTPHGDGESESGVRLPFFQPGEKLQLEMRVSEWAGRSRRDIPSLQ